MHQLVWTAITLAAANPAALPCSIARTGEMYVREATETWILGSVLPTPITTTKRPEARSRVFADVTGHAVAIESVSGLGAGTTIMVGDTVAIFTWVVAADCAWLSRGKTLPDSTRQHFTVSLRPDSLWVNEKVPTFDVAPEEGLTVYPGRTDHPLTINVDQYAEFVSLIPTRSEWNEDCRPGVRRANRWIRSHLLPGDLVAFPDVIEGLISACEHAIGTRAERHLRHGVGDLPRDVLRWSEREGCKIGRPYNNLDSPMNAVSGRFVPDDSAAQWAVVCARPNDWRLLIVVPGEDRVIAELARFAGSDLYWFVDVASPDYFLWASLEEMPPPAPPTPRPQFDSVILSRTHVFYWSSGKWVAVGDGCWRAVVDSFACGFRY